MKFWKPSLAAFIFATLLTACSAPPDDSASSNSNISQQSNSNSAGQQAAQGNAPSPGPGTSPLTLQQLPPPAKPPKPVENSMARANPNANRDANANTSPAVASTEGAPKLIVPEKRLDFGKQPQDKTMIRAIPIKNGGLSMLNIDSVTPS